MPLEVIMSKDTVLNPMEKEMVALAASVAAGCQPCTVHHIEAARDAGTCDRGITLALTAAAGVRRAATEAMASFALDQFGGKPGLPEDWLAQHKLIQALVSATSAFAVNSVPEFRRYTEEAHRQGATDRQIQMAIAIARKIKGVASEKMEAAAQQLLADYQPEEHLVGGRCGCPA